MGIERRDKNKWKEYVVIGIVGSRRRNSPEDYAKVKKMFEGILEDQDLTVSDVVICSGGCKQGGDAFAEKIAAHYEVPILIHYAAWHRHGKAAGFIRNSEIARDSDFLIACVAEDRKGGTEDTITKFRQMRPDDPAYGLYLV